VLTEIFWGSGAMHLCSSNIWLVKLLADYISVTNGHTKGIKVNLDSDKRYW
jgi:hypothetical protein